MCTVSPIRIDIDIYEINLTKKAPNMLKTADAFSLTIDTYMEFQQGWQMKKTCAKKNKKKQYKAKS
jgi:hypothetical protein